MLKIGEFSKIAQVSIKTLRYYDRMGLLKPAHIDRYSSYRYYTLSQLPRLKTWNSPSTRSGSCSMCTFLRNH